MSARSTIVALASGGARAAVAIIRISGPQAASSAERLGATNLRPRQAHLRRLIDPTSGEELDRAVVVSFPAPASFTGEDVVELQVHGGRAVVASVLNALASLGVALAEPGEFTRRAFDNGKLDLTEVEALADLVAAETSEQQRQAVRQFNGALKAQAEHWREALISAAALLEAAIDFPDEDLPQHVADRARPPLAGALAEISGHLADSQRGERLRDGLCVALVGPVNAGKSTLLNALARRDVAIVSEHAGTTRDVLEVQLDLAGLPVTLLDTAGLRDSTDPVEREGVRRARERAAHADMRLALIAADEGWDWRSLDIAPTADDILVITKIDLARGSSGENWPGAVERISALTGEGLEAVVELIKERARRLMAGASAPIITRARHRHELERARDALRQALRVDHGSPELIAEEVRRACHALGRLTGRVDVEELLDRIFAEFCIGK
jgi:tRNA modification GTPase